MPAVALHPPEDVARSLLAMTAEPTTGGTWVPVDPPGSIAEHVFPPPP